MYNTFTTSMPVSIIDEDSDYEDYGLEEELEDDDTDGDPVDLRYDPFPNCCGIKILSNFGWTATTIGADVKFNKNSIKEELKGAELSLRNRKGRAESMLMVALNRTQYTHLWKDVFEPLGWETSIKDIRHPSHSSLLFVLTKALYQPKPRKNKKSTGGASKEVKVG